MLRAVSVVSTEGRAFELLVAARRDGFKLFRVSTYCSATRQQKQQHHTNQTVLTGEGRRDGTAPPAPRVAPLPPPPPPSPPPPPPSRRAWNAAAAALALTASLGGVYFYRKLNENEKRRGRGPAAIPADAAAFPAHVHFLLVGGGTASFAAMRAIRSARPEAQVLIVGDEPQLPYMRPPLSKELWREPRLPALEDDLDALAFRQWNGRRRSVTYEPPSFYTPVEELERSGGAASIARGWRVVRIDPDKHEAELRAPGDERALVRYDKCLIATGAALAERLRDSGREVVQVFREEAPMAAVLPPYLAAEAARRLAEAGVLLRPGLALQLASGERLEADLAVECVGGEVDSELARSSGLETHPELGGLVVNAELQARSDVFAAGDAACFYDVALGRRRVEHHDHAVVSGRLAGENMAALHPPKRYTHQSMFWSDLGPLLGYEAIGLVDSRLPTVGVFSSEAVAVAAAAGAEVGAQGEAGEAAARHRYERGVVFFVRERRVVGVLLWNLFNRMHVARAVLAHGDFDDLFEVAKLFSLHEED
ncbi:hypothetical protein K1T71_011587 [Dendrolimus kikuchii]|uniref:Uncharacterized protein n=2 Tax=Dendrolimus kikuchii TaxID=765133 RepID=A0ACC1CLT6_9NEOP|nr:hypothetical protein K1T71_011576 [Dendrolimus kikuchii]KAJ0172448.1 hypothetical protein K1T71_011587 [Dendrolimus kikuchii]